MAPLHEHLNHSGVYAGRMSLTHPTISILTPTFNQAPYIGDAMASVRMQGFPSVEHIVADGASTDGTVDLLQGFPDVRWDSRPDTGMSDALNRAASMARGEIIGWLNSDDYYMPGCLWTVQEYFARHPEADVIHGDSLWVDSEGRLLEARSDHRMTWSTLLYWTCYVQSTTCFFRRSLLDRGLLHWDESTKYQMDRELFLRMAEAGVRFAYVPAVLAAFRWHGENASLQRSGSIAERVLIQARYSPRVAQSRVLRKASRGLFRSWHWVLKAQSGGFAVQRRWAGLAGQSTLWMRASQQLNEAVRDGSDE